MNRTVRTTALALGLCSTVALTGCVAAAAGAAAGAGAYAYAKGDLEATRDAPLDRAWDATLAAIDELAFPVHASSKDALQGRLKAERADGADITIKLDRLSPEVTRFRIRVGIFGDEATSRLIMEEIDRRL